MASTDAFAADNLKKFAIAWYNGLDIHAAGPDLHRFLASEGLEMAFPEKTMRSYDDFDEWLDAIYRTFFDENHNVHTVTVTAQTDTTADLDVVVAWQASWFTPPDAKSKRTSMNAIQRWTVQAGDKNAYGLEILRYAVDRFDYAPGFAQL
jgi:hypothetical protein